VDSTSGALGLVMGGGGARAAYQVGFLSCIGKHWPELTIPILTGVSAGAINTAYIANHPGPFGTASADLARLWATLETESVMASDVGTFVSSVLRWSLRLVSGGSALRPSVRGMVDTAPLRAFLERALAAEDGRIPGIAENLRRGRISAVAVTTTDYATGQSITHVQGNDPAMWRRPHRRSERAEITVDHVMASAALPLFFPAVRVGGSWHGDGGVRLTAPLSPALRLGADRILAISTRYQKSQAEADMPVTSGYPPPAQVLGVLMNAVFLDMLDYDALNMARINELIAALPPERRGGLRVARLLLMRPSRDLAAMAREYEPRLPQPLRFLTRGLGTRETRSPDSLSMVLFERPYLEHMIELGFQDAERRLEEIEAFLGGRELPEMLRTGFWRV
jgi:NTE family protein